LAAPAPDSAKFGLAYCGFNAIKICKVYYIKPHTTYLLPPTQLIIPKHPANGAAFPAILQALQAAQQPLSAAHIENSLFFEQSVAGDFTTLVYQAHCAGACIDSGTGNTDYCEEVDEG
jgi:hypothetical protein